MQRVIEPRLSRAYRADNFNLPASPAVVTAVLAVVRQGRRLARDRVVLIEQAPEVEQLAALRTEGFKRIRADR